MHHSTRFVYLAYRLAGKICILERLGEGRRGERSCSSDILIANMTSSRLPGKEQRKLIKKHGGIGLFNVDPVTLYIPGALSDIAVTLWCDYQSANHVLSVLVG